MRKEVNSFRNRFYTLLVYLQTSAKCTHDKAELDLPLKRSPCHRALEPPISASIMPSREYAKISASVDDAAAAWSTAFCLLIIASPWSVQAKPTQIDQLRMASVVPDENDLSIYPSHSALTAIRAVLRAGLLPSSLQTELSGMVSLGDEHSSAGVVGVRSENEDLEVNGECDLGVMVKRRLLVDLSRWARSEKGIQDLAGRDDLGESSLGFPPDFVLDMT